MILSITIITLNEEKHLSKCLESVKGIADEIIVVDSGSTDKTVEIAQKFGAKIFTRKFDNYSNQKNYAAEKAMGDWILSIDGDEELETDLRREIELEVEKNRHVAYSIPRKNIIFGKFIKYTRWQKELDRHVWLWKKGMGEWVGDVHEEFKVEGSVGKLKNAKIHHQYETVSEFLEMMNKYSELETKTKFSLLKFFWDPIYNFLVRYFYRLGFLDGLPGLRFCLMKAAFYKYLTQYKKELRRDVRSWN